MEDEITCDCCGELFFEDELQDGFCATCEDKEPRTLDQIAQNNGFSSWGASYEQ